MDRALHTEGPSQLSAAGITEMALLPPVAMGILSRPGMRGRLKTYLCITLK